MANYCFTTYIVEGKRDTLIKFKNAIDEAVKKYHTEESYHFDMQGVLIGLGLYAGEEAVKEATKDYSDETPEGLGIYGDWMDAEVKDVNGQDVLMFREEYKWNCSCNMETISKLPAFKDDVTAVYRYSEESGCGIYERSDKEQKYFTDEYIKSLGYEPEDIKEPTGMTAGEYRKLAEKIIAENTKN